LAFFARARLNIEFALCNSAMPVAASPVTWQVSNLVFGDGGTLAGTFSFDAATGACSSIDLSSTAGTTITSNRHCGRPPLQRQATNCLA
jgi:hypothetical protein